MTDALTSSSGPHTWWHYLARALPGLYVASAGVAFASLPPQLGKVPLLALFSGQWLSYGMSAHWNLAYSVLTVCVLFSLIGMIRHGRTLCLRCVKRLPLVPGDVADRSTPLFWLAHKLLDHKKATTLVMLAVIVTGELTPSGWPAHSLSFAENLGMAALAYSLSRHSVLQPWCPWCRDEGGDDDTELSPEPEPGLSLPSGNVS